MFIEFKDNLFDDYLILDAEQKTFLQRLIFYEYVEQAEKDKFHKKNDVTLYSTLYNDMLEYQKDENYEACQAMKDIIKRFKEEFGNY